MMEAQEQKAALPGALWQGASAAELATVKAAAATVCAEFVRLPDQFQFDLLEADAVSQLRADPEHGDLFRLLTILLTSASVKVSRTCPCCATPPSLAMVTNSAPSFLRKEHRIICSSRRISAFLASRIVLHTLVSANRILNRTPWLKQSGLSYLSTSRSER